MNQYPKDDNASHALFVRPMDKGSISHRLRHVSCAIICESSKKIQKQKDVVAGSMDDNGGTRCTNNSKNETALSSQTTTISIPSLAQYELRPPRPSATLNNREEADREKEKFTIGLQLLQNDIIALSIQAGVPVATLWPAEAMLLNLYSLKLYCLNQCGM